MSASLSRSARRIVKAVRRGEPIEAVERMINRMPPAQRRAVTAEIQAWAAGPIRELARLADFEATIREPGNGDPTESKLVNEDADPLEDSEFMKGDK